MLSSRATLSDKCDSAAECTAIDSDLSNRRFRQIDVTGLSGAGVSAASPASFRSAPTIMRSLIFGKRVSSVTDRYVNPRVTRVAVFEHRHPSYAGCWHATHDLVAAKSNGETNEETESKGSPCACRDLFTPAPSELYAAELPPKTSDIGCRDLEPD